MYRAYSQFTLDAPWLSMEPIVVGPRPTGAGTPPAYVMVERDGRPFARVDAYIGSAGAFTQVTVWQRFVVLGSGCCVHLIDPASRQTHAIECDGYFGHLYPRQDCLLVASASELICVDEQGGIAWERAGLGIDGVVVERVEDGIILGQGEWDPPGGWCPFRLSLATGLPESGPAT